MEMHHDMEMVKQGIDNVSDWLNNSSLRLNPKYMIMSKLRTKGIPIPNLMLCNNPLEQVAEYKHLAVLP